MERGERWKLQFSLVVLSAYVYVFLEWMHFVTKPSFMSALDWGPRLAVLLQSPLPIGALGILLTAPLFLVSRLLRRQAVFAVSMAAAHLIPALVLSGLAFVTIDVFLKTMIGFSISGSSGNQRYLYALLLAALFASFYSYLFRFHKKNWVQRRCRVIFSLTIGLLLVSSASLLFSIASAPESVRIGSALDPSHSPNILLIASDGLEADHMSVYGYERDTTPFLRELAPQTLFCENAFSNAGPTGASLASMLSGKLPTETRLVYPPDILRGRHAYQHLPMILGNLGYRSIHLSIRNFADAYDLNMRESFDSSNFRSFDRVQTSPLLSRLMGPDTTYFLEHIRDRLESRLLHAFGLAVMEDPFKAVQEGDRKLQRDRLLLDHLYEFIDESSAPFLAHVHLMGTHGPRFRPRSNHTFSQGKDQTENWMADFFDDTILDFDGYLRELFAHLSETEKLESTVVVIHTDHGQRHRTDRRIPLMIRFPGGQHSGRIVANCQLLDVSPTILDFLNVPQPDWMGGRSLIRPGLDPDRPIFSFGRIHEKVVRVDNRLQFDSEGIKPPFYTLRYARVTIRDMFYQLDLKWNSFSAQRVANHTYPNDPTRKRSREEIVALLIEQLRTAGYDTADLDGLAR
jgi:arylsulfatase A-like enzyme